MIRIVDACGVSGTTVVRVTVGRTGDERGARRGWAREGEVARKGCSVEAREKCIIDFPGYRYHWVLFAGSDTYGRFLLFYADGSDARRSVPKILR